MSESSLPLLPVMLDNVPPGLRQALAQEGLPAVPRLPGVEEGRFVLFDSQAGPHRGVGPGQTAIDVAPLRQSWQSDPFAALIDQRSAPHVWRIGLYAVREEITRFDKHAIRQRLLGQLREVLEGLGGVWLRVAAYPFPYRSALNFRVDYDEYQPAGFAATMRAVNRRANCTTHFVCASTFAPHPEALAQLEGLDVGSHGYWHHTYRSEQENFCNIRRGVETLRACGFTPSGFAAPHGRTGAALLAALENLGIAYSSEFGLAYDELPFFPAGSHVLQIPVHPLCPELFVDAAQRTGADLDAAVATALDHFQHTAREKYRAGEPLFFYGHPTGPWSAEMHPLDALAAVAADCGALWPVTLSQFGAWWRVRSGVRLRATREGEEIAVSSPGPRPEYPLAIELCRGQHVARMPLGETALRFSPAALAYEPRPAPSAGFAPRRDRPHDFRERFKRWIDWERTTPLAEIPTSDWRNLIKRTLRRLRPERNQSRAPRRAQGGLTR